MARSARGPRNLLEMIPERAREWRLGEDGRVRVLVPRYGDTALGRWIAARVGRPHISVRLDEIGGEVWRACDGISTVGRIADGLQQRFGDRVAPLHQRLASFLRELERSRFIRWRTD
ncbi:MAG: PqqD family protein [Acidobacteriota bacterium]